MEIYVPQEIDWTWMGQAGLEEELTPYVIKNFEQEGVSIICKGWNWLFRIQELVYQELCWEFFSTVVFLRGDDIYNPKALTFCIVGEVRQCSIA